MSIVGLQELADCMKGGLPSNASDSIITKFCTACRTAAELVKVEFFIDEGITDYQASVIMRSAVLLKINEITDMIADALEKGFILPDSPFVKIDLVNAGRRLFARFVSGGNEQAIYDDVVKLAEVFAGYESGEIKFDRKPAFQLSSYELSVDGLTTQSGDALADILGYQPDADFIKRKRALDSLARLDFSKRRPYVLFTADFDNGTLVCWSKMHDASGYKIHRREVFSATELPDVYLDSAKLTETTKVLLQDDRFFQVLSFYDWLDHDDVMVYHEKNKVPDALYAFSITGIQKKAPGGSMIFDVPTSAVFFSPILGDRFEKLVAEESARFGRSAATISPYPALSEAIYGDSGYGWILAGCNVLAASRRGEEIDTVRSFGYIGSTADEIVAAARAGKLVVPQDVGTIQTSVENSVSSYGISQTIVAVLDGIGLTEFISGKDNPRGTSDVLKSTGNGVARILSAIDPVSATLDTSVLIASVNNPAQKLSMKASFNRVVAPRAASIIPLEQVIGLETIDLTTYSGIGDLMRIIRAIYDFYPGALT